MLFPQVDGRQLLVEASDGGQVTAIVPPVRYASDFVSFFEIAPEPPGRTGEPISFHWLC
jgi:hypothetical protein